MKPYFIEIRFNPTSNKFGGTLYLSNYIHANSLDEAKEIAMNKYKALSTEKGLLEVGANWALLGGIPTYRCLYVLRHNILNNDKTCIVSGGETRYFSSITDTKQLRRAWENINLIWCEVFYMNGAYHVPIKFHYAVNEVIIKSFQGTTKEVYDEALQFVKNNTQQKNYFRFNEIALSLHK